MMVELEKILREAISKKASDIFVIAGLPLSFKINGVITSLGGEKLMPDTTAEIIGRIYAAAGRPLNRLTDTGDDDFSLSVPGLSRFRICAYRQRGSLAAVIRVVSFEIPKPEKLSIPRAVIDIARDTQKGLIIVTGLSGSGKSTTLACMIDEINHTRAGHIITMEDPIEYFHRNDKCVVSQREMGADTDSYVAALRASMRQAPDVILVGEMRDYETIRSVITAAETGHLVISTLHTVGATNTVDRIIDVFPPAQQQQVRIQLAMLLTAVISQQLLPCVDGGLVPAFEIMRATSAVSNLIRDSKTHQLDAAIYSGSADGMVTMDASVYELYRAGRITAETAVRHARNPEAMKKRIGS